MKVVSSPAPLASSIVCIRYGLDRIYPDYGALALATERHEYLALKYEIEQMRQRNSIQGYVITELTDANWEANGLMSMWRQPKTFAGELGQLQQDDLVMANFATHNFITGAAVEVPLMVSHYSTSVLEGATILWQTSDGQSGTLPLSKTPGQGEVATEGTLHVQSAASERTRAGVSPPAVSECRRDDAGAESLQLRGVSATGRQTLGSRWLSTIHSTSCSICGRPSQPTALL